MRQDKKPLSICLEFTRKAKKFSPERLDYTVRENTLGYHTVSFPWDDPGIRQALDELKKEHPSSRALEVLGHHLHDFLEQAKWSQIESRIKTALQKERPIDLTIRTDASELYYLPWELLKLRSSTRQLAELSDCLIRCEWLQRDRPRPPPPKGRILLASSAAGGDVRFPEHLDAIQESCRRANFDFRPDQDVLPRLTRDGLARALDDTERPVTVLHLLCHGGLTREDVYGLVLSPENRDDDPDLLGPPELRRLLTNKRMASLRLVTLCACMSGDAVLPTDALGNIAQVFHRVGVPAVICSRFSLSCQGAVTLTKHLYSELLANHSNLRKAIASTRHELMLDRHAQDWAALQFYGCAKDEAALRPFDPPGPPSSQSPRPELVLICHEALSQVQRTPGHIHARELLDNRTTQPIVINQTQALGKNKRSNLPAQVRRLVRPDGELQSALRKPEVELLYYGFPLVPFAVLAGYLAKATRHVHVIEYDRNCDGGKGCFTWAQPIGSPYPALKMEKLVLGTGSAARIRISISSLVKPADCEEVFPREELCADLHFKVEQPDFGIVQSEEQAHAYKQVLLKHLKQCMDEMDGIGSFHVFAAVPVSIAFLLGQVLSATAFPRCYVYNFNRRAIPKPGYEWRLSLDDAINNQKPFVHIFKITHTPGGAS